MIGDTDLTLTTLVLGKSPEIREAAIAARLLEAGATAVNNVAVILEGLPVGDALLLASDCVHIVRIAAGCPCCSGNLIMRVTLNRILRKPPARLYIGLASNDHLQKIRHFLTQTPYSGLLRLTEDIAPQVSTGINRY